MIDFLLMNGKKALVIGGGLGMGESAVWHLASAGCDVAVLDIEPDRAEAVAERARQHGTKAFAFVADMMTPEAISPVIDRAVAALGGLDVLVTIVGNALWVPFVDMSLDDWDVDHHRNLRYVFLAGQTAANAMIKQGQGGAITVIASVSGQSGAPMHVAYGAAKAGLIAMTKTMAVELAEHSIRVNAVAPGVINTPRVAAAQDASDAEARMKASLIPFKRMGTPDEVAKGVLFLCSDMASYISGHVLNVDGGWSSAFLFPPSTDTQPKEI